MQLGGFTIFPCLIEGSLADLFLRGLAKEKHINSKKDLKNLAVDAGLDAIGKKIKKGLSSTTGSGITLTNNKIKDIMKVIRSLENRGILLKELLEKLLVKKEDFSIFLDHL